MGPGGTTIRIKNPLHSYRYDSPPDDAPPSDYKGELRVYFDEWTRTYRWASGKNHPNEDYMELEVPAQQNGRNFNSNAQLRANPDYQDGTQGFPEPERSYDNQTTRGQGYNKISLRIDF